MVPRCLYVGIKDLVRDRVSYANSRIVRSFSIVGALFVKFVSWMVAYSLSVVAGSQSNCCQSVAKGVD
jgi:hypothetical protein